MRSLTATSAVDSDDEVQRDGIAWLVSRRAAPSLAKLEHNLTGVETLFKARLGENVDYDNVKRVS